jgi:subtilisin family serine protease
MIHRQYNNASHDFFISLFILLDFLFDLQWGHTAVRAVEAWNAGVTGAGVRVCVLDTGFDMSHPDLVGNINQTLSFDFTGDIQDIPGAPDYLSKNIYSHGSHVAGTIAAANSKFPRVLAPGLIVSRPLSTHHVHTFDLGCYTYSRWLWDDWSSSRRGACLVSLPGRTENSVCTCLQPQLTVCFIPVILQYYTESRSSTN